MALLCGSPAMARYILNDTGVPVDTGKTLAFPGGVPMEEIFNVQASPKCGGCQTFLAIRQEQPYRVKTASSEDSSPASSDDDGLYAGPELVR